MNEEKKKKGGHLHEILAVIGDLQGTKEKILGETIHTFGKKVAHFSGWHRRLEMIDSTRSGEETQEHQAIVTTVMQKLEYMSKSCTKFWDVKFQKECGGQLAHADIIIDDGIIAKDVPVYFLLEMENELKQLRKIYDEIPTLQPGVEWKRAEDLGKDIWKSEYSQEKTKTEKTYEHKVLVPATDKHPAQIREWTEDKIVGKYITDAWSGMLSPAEKSNLLEKLDKLVRAVKKARQRANTQEVPRKQIGAAIFKYLLVG
jgi:hypothetical protein